MKSILSDQAKLQIRTIARYIRMEFGKNHRDEFMQTVRHARRLIEDNPQIGQIEPLLVELPKVYRSYVMNHHNKIVYRIENDTIFIADLWDVRRNPEILINQLE